MSIQLSEEQEKAVREAVETSNHMTIIGKAGVGKSVLLRSLREALHQQNKKAVVAAPTGVAALAVGGSTVHNLINRLYGLSSRQSAYEEAPRIDTVIIDEVSMLRADLFDKLDKAMRAFSRKNIPFGGIPVRLFGDPGQLPPVVKDGAEKAYIDDNYLTPYFFSAACFAAVDWSFHELTHIFRQADPDYVTLLNLIRSGERDRTVRVLNSDYFKADSIQGCLLCSRNDDADKANKEMLEALDAEQFDFKAMAFGDIKPWEYPAPEILSIKIGARVMVIKNIYTENGMELTNGDWCEVLGVKNVTPEDNNPEDPEPQLPEFEIEVFCERTQRTHFIKQAIWEQKALAYDETTKELTEEIVAKFVQFPLRLAWAITIHKSQGASLPLLTIDCRKRFFSPYQLYVACSRGTSLEGLFILGNVAPSDIIVCPHIAAFLNDFKTGVGIKPGGIHDKATAEQIFNARAAKRNVSPPELKEAVREYKAEERERFRH